MNLRVLIYLNYYDSGNSVILEHYEISKMEIFTVYWLHSCGDRDMRPLSVLWEI